MSTNTTTRATAIRARGIRKRYRGADAGTPPALDGVDLTVEAGRVHGLLGPNGAGKTTAVRVMTTLLDLDEGDLEVAGYDVRTQGAQVRRHIGLVGQDTAVDEELSGRQNLTMFGRLSGLSPSAARKRGEELLEQFDLADTGRTPVRAYSGGMRRRLDLAAALIVAPPLLFVDEPTTGLDPAARQLVWAELGRLVRAGTTVLLTTQYLEEADRLADRLTLLAKGRVVAEGSPAELKSLIGGDWFELTPRTQDDTDRLCALVAPWASGPVRRVDAHVQVPVQDRVGALFSVTAALTTAGIDLNDLVVRTPSLDEAFLHLTGTRNVATEGALA